MENTEQLDRAHFSLLNTSFRLLFFVQCMALQREWFFILVKHHQITNKSIFIVVSLVSLFTFWIFIICLCILFYTLLINGVGSSLYGERTTWLVRPEPDSTALFSWYDREKEQKFKEAILPQWWQLSPIQVCFF